MRIFILLVLLFGVIAAQAQNCTTPGQTPATAFPVCGTTTFQQASVPICVTQNLTVPGCSGGGYQDKNPFWYRIICHQTGTLGFLIRPNASNEDYDWQLYDITGKDPNAVFTDPSTVIIANWAGTYGNTGASSAGVSSIQCGSDPAAGAPTFSTMPTLIVGHTYLLLISHFTDTQSGYSLSFGGGTAVITDPNIPRLKSGEANCGGDVIRLKLSKNIYCNSISGNGSEFYIKPSAATTISATGIRCTTGFDTDSLEIRLSTVLNPGSYTLHIKKGTDGNTLLDYCNNAVPETDSIPFVLLPKFPTPMDSLVQVTTCSPNQVKLVFSRAMECSSIAANGSDFAVTGTYPVTVSAASGSCANGLTKEILVTFAAPLQRAGNFNLVLKAGTDGNTLINECGEATPAGASLPFSVVDTVNANFTYAIGYGCQRDTVRYFHNAANGVNSWSWALDEGQQSTAQNPTGIYSVFNEKTVRLAVTNGVCKDTATQTVALVNYLRADFSVLRDNCPQEMIPFRDSSIGRGLTYAWNFGDGAVSDSANPHHAYAGPVRETTYQVRLTITDSFGCQQTAQRPVTIYNSCYLAVPNAFTPNNDGRNDLFKVLNAVKTEDFELTVYNRWGQLVFQTRNWKQGWDGKFGGREQGTAAYVWLLRYTDRDTKKKIEQKGTMVLIR